MAAASCSTPHSSAASWPRPSSPSWAVGTGGSQVDPHGQATTYVFEYGPTSAYGSTTKRESAGSGTSSVNVQARTAALRPGTTYHVRIVATNPSGTADGPDRTFTVARTPPAVGAVSASSVSTSGATLRGAIDPRGEATTYVFQYGPTTHYGFSTKRESAGSGTASVTVQARTGSLKAGITYHVRLVATNASGSTDGPDRSFTVPKATTKPKPTPKPAPKPTPKPAPRQVPPRLTVSTGPRRRRHAPYAFTTHGHLRIPATMSAAQGCNGEIVVRFRRGRRTYATARTLLTPSCAYRVSVVLGRVPHGRYKVLVGFQGNASLVGRRARTRTVRVG